MQKILVVGGISIANPLSGLLVFLGFLAIEIAGAAQRHRNRGALARTVVTPSQAEAFRLRMQEHEFRVVNVGQSLGAIDIHAPHTPEEPIDD